MIEVVAEFGQACRGDLAVAMRQADAAHQAGCAYVKLQTFDPARLAGPTARRYWAAHLGGADSQLETFQTNGMLKPADWRTLADYCHTLGVGFMSSPFDLEAVDLLVDAGVDSLKIASGEITHRQLLQRVAETGLPIVLSTGAATRTEIEQALEWLCFADVTLLACTLSYPTADHDAELGRIGTLRDLFYNPVGYSDHTLRTDTALAAVCAGADMLEKHCTLDAAGGVPDDKMALDPVRLRQYVAYARLGEQMRGEGTLTATDAEQAARAGARRSLHAARDIAAGEKFGPGDFACLRPAGPFVPADEGRLLGQIAARDIEAGSQIRQEDVA